MSRTHTPNCYATYEPLVLWFLWAISKLSTKNELCEWDHLTPLCKLTGLSHWKYNKSHRMVYKLLKYPSSSTCCHTSFPLSLLPLSLCSFCDTLSGSYFPFHSVLHFKFPKSFRCNILRKASCFHLKESIHDSLLQTFFFLTFTRYKRGLLLPVFIYSSTPTVWFEVLQRYLNT